MSAEPTFDGDPVVQISPETRAICDAVQEKTGRYVVEAEAQTFLVALTAAGYHVVQDAEMWFAGKLWHVTGSICTGNKLDAVLRPLTDEARHD